MTMPELGITKPAREWRRLSGGIIKSMGGAIRLSEGKAELSGRATE